MRRSLAKTLGWKSPNDVVILSAIRTPIRRGYKGGLKKTHPEELLATVLDATLRRSPNLCPTLIQDVCVGTVLSELGGSKVSRAALNSVEGFQSSRTSLYTVNRACASSLQSVSAVAGQIVAGSIDIGIGAGMESMTRNYGTGAIPVDVWPHLKTPLAGKDAQDCFMPMGVTSDNVARRYGVSRQEQDLFAATSQQRAAAAREAGRFRAEITPVQTVDTDQTPLTITEDNGIRPGTTAESLSRLRPAFSDSGSSTAGNSSQISDGAAAILLLRRSRAVELGLAGDIIGRFVGSCTEGARPDEMGVGPAVAIPPLLARWGLETSDIDRWEINEAFASQYVYSVRELGLMSSWEQGKVNPDGGAIALGHPLGATGARLVTTLLHGLGRSGGEIGVVSMCVGTGMGMAGVFMRE